MNSSFFIHKKYLVAFLGVFVAELLIAVFVHDAFIRPFVGDVLVMFFMYTFLRIVDIRLKNAASEQPRWYRRWIAILPILLFFFACAVEISQYFHLDQILGLERYPIARIILGSTFDWMDILCYFVGTVLLLLLQKYTEKK